MIYLHRSEAAVAYLINPSNRLRMELLEEAMETAKANDPMDGAVFNLHLRIANRCTSYSATTSVSERMAAAKHKTRFNLKELLWIRILCFLGIKY